MIDSLGMKTIELPLQKSNEFQRLQSKLRQNWTRLDDDASLERDILVIPSLSLDEGELAKVPGSIHYEERLLFSLIRLWQPRTRLIYVTSQPISPIVIDYYLQLIHGIPAAHARDRLILFSTEDASLKPLTQKILERPRLLDRIRRAIDPEKAFAVCYNSTYLERELSIQLQIPLFALDPDLLHWGTKSGSREIFADTEILHPDGSQLVFDVASLAGEIVNLWTRNPDLKRVVIKLNEGFSGEGNALCHLGEFLDVVEGKFWDMSATERPEAIVRHLPDICSPTSGESWQRYSERIPKLGAIVEAFVEGKIKTSPSVQGKINPDGTIEIISTHDQILGGADGQIYLGCTFPAAPDYRMQLQELGQKVGIALAQKGALERFAVDFVAVGNDRGEWELHAIEINLRKGGTTHPLMMLKLLTRGIYHSEDGLFYSDKNLPKYYIATDNLTNPNYCQLLPRDLIEIVADRRLHYDPCTQTGTVFHLIGCLSQYGKLGLTCIADTPDLAVELYQHVKAVLDAETAVKSV
jgi:hypothetical protein